MEACGSAHHWGRELSGLGHEVKLIAPKFVRAFVKTNKTDAADAQAIWEASQRPGMRAVALKSKEQQSVLALHRVREQLIHQAGGGHRVGVMGVCGVGSEVGARSAEFVADVLLAHGRE